MSTDHSGRHLLPVRSGQQTVINNPPSSVNSVIFLPHLLRILGGIAQKKLLRVSAMQTQLRYHEGYAWYARSHKQAKISPCLSVGT